MTAQRRRRAWTGYIEFDINVDCSPAGRPWGAPRAGLTRQTSRVTGTPSPDAGAPDERSGRSRKRPGLLTEPCDDGHLSALEGMVSAAAKCVSADGSQSGVGAAAGGQASGTRFARPANCVQPRQSHPTAGTVRPGSARQQTVGPAIATAGVVEPRTSDLARSRHSDWRPSP